MTTHLSASERTLRARLAAHSSWANTENRTARTAAATAASMSRFERQVDPDGVLDPAERARRADSARKAYYTRLAFKSVKARRAKATGTTPTNDEEAPDASS